MLYCFIKRWSTDRNLWVVYQDGRQELNVNLKIFHKEPIHTLADLTTACQWGKLGKQFKKYKDVLSNLFYCTPGYNEHNKEKNCLSSAECLEWFERRDFADWSTFDDFVNHSRKLHFIQINKANFKLSQCIC